MGRRSPYLSQSWFPVPGLLVSFFWGGGSLLQEQLVLRANLFSSKSVTLRSWMFWVFAFLVGSEGGDWAFKKLLLGVRNAEAL